MKTSLTTELEAINLMLSVIGEAPVNNAEDNGVIDAVIARQILNDTSREVQSRGWHWNTDKGLELSPTYPLPGELLLPANTLQVDTVYPDAGIDAVQRGNKLWDRRNHTYRFDRPVRIDLIRFLDFEELPQAARTYITVRAARIFQDRVVGSDTLNGFNEKDEVRALVVLRNAEAETGGYNMLADDWSVGRVLWR